MKKVPSRGRVVVSLAVFFASLLMLAPFSLADQGPATPQDSEKGGFFSGITKGLSNLTSGLPNIFSELSPADVGHKPRIRPHFSFNQGFNSNADFGTKQADAAWQARMAPGITVSIPSGKLYTEADYTYGFSTTQGRRSHSNINTHNINALARYDLSTDTVVGVGNNFQISELPGDTDRTFMLETATTQVMHRLSPKLIGSVNDTFQWFKDSSKTTRVFGIGAASRDKEQKNTFVDNGVGTNLGYDATSDLTVGPSFNWNIRHYDTATGKSYWQILPAVNASYKLGPKTTVTGDFGWAFRKFSDKTTSTNGDRESELVYGAGVNHLLGRKFVWSLNYAKTLQDTFDTSFVLRDNAQAVSMDNLDRQFRVLESHRIGTNATYHFDERNSLGAFGDVSFVNGNADDNIITHQKSHEKTMEVGGSYTYRVNRYISLGVQYTFGRRFTADNSLGSRNQYTFHKVTGGVNITV